MSWFKSGNSSESYYDFKGHLYTPSGTAWYWKDKEVYIFKMWLKEPAKGHGITIEIKGDMPNTGCKDGTTSTFLINDDYRIIFPPEMNKYPCFDSVAINGLYLRSEFSNYDPMLIKNGDNILKETIEKIDIEKKEIAGREAEKARFKKAWNEAKKESSGEFIEQSSRIVDPGLHIEFRHIIDLVARTRRHIFDLRLGNPSLPATALDQYFRISFFHDRKLVIKTRRANHLATALFGSDIDVAQFRLDKPRRRRCGNQKCEGKKHH